MNLKELRFTEESVIDVNFVKEIDRILNEINALDNPTFMENGVIIKINDDFMYTGLSNIDFITMDYYKNR